MKYIDKNALLKAGRDITDQYLETTCKVDDGAGNFHYQNVDYDGTFGDTGAKNAMMQLALDSQESFCCYCMRDMHLQNQIVTLEHIIPQSSDSEKFNRYVGYNVAPLTAQYVVRTGDFTGVQNVNVPPRPHTVAFENLVASCDGTFPDKKGSSQCCNNKRGQEDIYPLFYVVTVGNEIAYTEDGSMQPNAQCALQAEYRITIEKARLNCTNLQDIRRLWHLFAGERMENLTACIADKNKRSMLLLQVLYHDNRLMMQDARIHNKFMRDEYWKTFLMYHWFHHRI
jgi:hypothetical protein